MKIIILNKIFGGIKRYGSYRRNFNNYMFYFFLEIKTIKKIIFVDETINYILYICKQDNKDSPYPKSIIIRGMLYGEDTLWRI